ncbi:hypothetical protein QLX08_001160 [Tetragonisca angustula]|uniref:Uncharacterized protein n=1 Tax=Tetragonisca angustula TaxID=166442 RepID=A0AAW1AG25_9HYME
MAPSNGRFMLMHLRPSTVGVRVHCLVARRLRIASIRRWCNCRRGIRTENCNVGADNVVRVEYGVIFNCAPMLQTATCLIPLNVQYRSKGARLHFTDSTERRFAED